ncbi:hypothetical protein MCAMS1_00274 [biofilm metagenome]
MHTYNRYFKVVLLAISAINQGCALRYGPDDQSREEFERRVEAAFRLQNQMTSEVMVIQTDGTDNKEHLPIIQAEQLMESNCRYLNEYASREIDGLNKSLLLLKRVENSVVDCEKSARNVDELLKIHHR